MKSVQRFWIAVLAFCVCVQASTATTEKRVLQGHIPSAAARSRALDRLSGSSRLQLAIGVSLRNQPGLTGLLQDIYDPASANDRQYLTPTQFAARFGPSEEDYQAVAAFAEGHGLTVTGRSTWASSLGQTSNLSSPRRPRAPCCNWDSKTTSTASGWTTSASCQRPHLFSKRPPMRTGSSRSTGARCLGSVTRCSIPRF